MMNCILVTGGAGFIGSNFILECFKKNPASCVINVDKLTYAGNAYNLNELKNHRQYQLVQADIANDAVMEELLRRYQPQAVINFAAESHVDRSIHSPDAFIQTNIVGTFHLLETVRHYWQSLATKQRESFRFLHVSTDEVFGSLGVNESAFTEATSYAPNSPYSASKAASDHLVRAWYHTYGLPVLTTNCSNNYGAFQFPEKLIPLIILNALDGKSLPIYGDGLHIRDWLYVEDHCAAIRMVLSQGKVGETYNIGGANEQSNKDVVTQICLLLDELRPRADGVSYVQQITFIKDRLGHDRRYAVDISKIERELGWTPQETFATGLRKTVNWYLENQLWIQQVRSGDYRNWIAINYGGGTL